MSISRQMKTARALHHLLLQILMIRQIISAPASADDRGEAPGFWWADPVVGPVDTVDVRSGA